MTSQNPVECPRCGNENLAGSKFCAQCGNRLEIICPVCSTSSQIGARFCSNCGTALSMEQAATSPDDLSRYVPEELLKKIRAARSGHAMRGERRTVTMLFADIQGSTAAAEGLDPEDWTDIVNGVFSRLIAPIYRYEGTLASLQGDAILAFFGAPIAHEDDPVRAVRAGLEILEGIKPYRDEVHQRWGISVNVRVGINTGLVVVGEVGSNLRMEYTAIGDAINVAARMEQTADPGTVRVTGETWALVADHFEAEEIGRVEVKGKSEPVLAFHVLRPLERAPTTAEERTLVGRSDELGVLDGLRDRLMNGGGWIASIMGEAGVGKSRLLEEFRRQSASILPVSFTRDAPGELAWMFAAIRSYNSSVPYSTIADLLIRWWGLDQTGEPFTTVEGITTELGLDEVQDSAVYLAHVAQLALPDSASRLVEQLEPPVLHSRTRVALAAYLESEAARRPLIVALEDLHWADSMSLALFDDLMGLADRAGLGLLFSMRPYRDEATWRTHEVAQRDYPHRYHPIELQSLSTDPAEQLLDELLEDIVVPESTRRRILERSDGNPLFIEQMVRALGEGDEKEQIAVPKGLSSVLTARLDRLHEESKLVAQMASVIGSEFDRSALAALVGDEVDFGQRMTDLLRREILVERKGATGPILAFHHALMQEAAYSTVLLRTRRELHNRVAEYLVKTTPDSVHEIARHYLEAGELAAAFPHLITAGEKSARSMALSDAIRLFTTALDNISAGADQELVIRAHDGLGIAHSLVPDLTQSAAAYQRLVDYAEQTEVPSAKVTALNRLAFTTASLAGDYPTALGYLSDAARLAEEIGDDSGLAEYHMTSCFLAVAAGELETALAHDEETTRLGATQDVDRIRIEGLVRAAANATALMDFDKAVPAVEDAIQAAIEAGDEHRLAIVQTMGASRLRLREGDIDGALQLLLDNESTLTRYASFYAPVAQFSAGVLLYERGDIESAVSRLSDSSRRSTSAEQPYATVRAATNAMLAQIYAELGMGELVPELRGSAIKALEEPLGHFLANTVWAELGLANLALDRPQDAYDDFARGLATSSTSRFWERPRLLTGRAQALGVLGNYAEAHRDLDEAQTLVLDTEVRVFDARLAYAQARVLAAEGSDSDALAKFAQALEAASAIGQRPLLVQIAVAAGRVALAAGQPEPAGKYISAAQEEVEAMAKPVIDPALRSALESAWLSPLEELASGV